MATSATTMSFFMVPPWVDAGDRPCVGRNAPRRRSLARRTRSPAGGRVWPIGGVKSPRRGAAERPFSASGQRGGLWAGSGGAHIRSSRRTTPGRATRDSSTACAPGPPPLSRGSTSGTPRASTTSPCAWSGTGRTPRTSPRTCSSAPSSACRGTARCCCGRGCTGSRSTAATTTCAGPRDARSPIAAGTDRPSPQDPYEQSELQRLLEGAIGDLTRRQRAALLLKDVHGLSLVEVAACLDVTPGSVEVLLARARRAFRARFEERCTAAGRSLPRSAGGLAALPLLPLPAGLAVAGRRRCRSRRRRTCRRWRRCARRSPWRPGAASAPRSVCRRPLKTAVLIAAAAATVGTAEIAVTRADHRPPRAAAGSAALVVQAPAVAAPTPPRAGARGRRATDRRPSRRPPPRPSRPRPRPRRRRRRSPSRTPAGEPARDPDAVGVARAVARPRRRPTPRRRTPRRRRRPTRRPLHRPPPTPRRRPPPRPDTSLRHTLTSAGACRGASATPLPAPTVRRSSYCSRG